MVAQWHCINTKGLIYDGNVSVTQQNIECQRWDSQHPHAHKHIDPSLFPDTTLADAENYCRALDASHIPLCYTTSAEHRWDHCDLDAIYWGNKFIVTILDWHLGLPHCKHSPSLACKMCAFAPFSKHALSLRIMNLIEYFQLSNLTSCRFLMGVNNRLYIYHSRCHALPVVTWFNSLKPGDAYIRQ